MPVPPPEPASEPIAAAIDGLALTRAFAAGAEALVRQADALNAINVFPVPDGDTGTNMSLTMRAALDAIATLDAGARSSVARVVKAAADGTLMGARGNSGVILSQIIGGFVEAGSASDASTLLDATGLAAALERGRAAAYRVVSSPQEGTILTAITAAAEAAKTSAAADDSFDSALAAAADAARDAAARTPELLPVLKQAGVVDAGAEGLSVLLDGMLRGFRGEAARSDAIDLGAIDASWLSATRRTHGEGATSGFCTEFVIQGGALDAAVIRAALREGAESLLVVGGGDLVRVHLHTQTPDNALVYARTLGTVSHEKIDDMEAQFQRLAAAPADATNDAHRPADALAVVAVAAGAGIEALLESLGAGQIVRGGQTMNPSAGQIRDALLAAGATSIIVLPNNKNIILAAEQAAESLRADMPALAIAVVPTRSIPQGVAALVAMNLEATLRENIEAMEAAVASVRTAEVTFAARATRLDGVAVAEGQPIGLIEGDLAVAGDTVADVVRACVARLVEERAASLITLYAGEQPAQPEAVPQPDEARANAARTQRASDIAHSADPEAGATAVSAGDSATAELAAALRDEFGIDVEVVAGGQPHYPYIIGVE